MPIARCDDARVVCQGRLFPQDYEKSTCDDQRASDTDRQCRLRFKGDVVCDLKDDVQKSHIQSNDLAELNGSEVETAAIQRKKKCTSDEIGDANVPRMRMESDAQERIARGFEDGRCKHEEKYLHATPTAVA